MSRAWIFSLPCLLSPFLYGDDQPQEPLVPPEKIESQLKAAEKEFDEAKKMFNPWYTGPLITPSAHVLPPPHVAIQPYLFYICNYAAYDKHGHSHSIPHFNVLKPALAPLQVGITEWMDTSLTVQGVYNHQSGHSYMNWGDTTLNVGFGLLKETAYHPAIKFVIQESFPTGHYQKFNPKKPGVESTGAGSFETQLSLNISKVVWWLTLHPMNFRLSLNYTFNGNVHVRGFNTYGGGSGTAGTVKGGNTFAADFGYEYSFTQRWVAALDIVYNCSAKNTFSGQTTAPVGFPFNEQLSFAPALEYNVNENLGFLAGVWFTAWGRSSFDFASGIVSFTYTF